ncbi:MAG: glycosyltransferase family 1 protein [Calditrichaeota bacterium]|nr:MAG: glycosyltransferase family 1 protein [Calditrichota bacterium]
MKNAPGTNMHIVVDAHLAVKQIDGVARYLLGLLSELPGLDPAIRYTVLTLPPQESCLPDELFTRPNVRRVELNVHGPSPKQHLLIPRLLRELAPDVYHHPQYDLPLGVSVPTVITIHDLKYLFHPEFLQKHSRLKSLYIRASLLRSVKQANQVIAVSENTLKDLGRLVALPARKTSVIHHGIGLAAVPTSAPSSLSLDLPEDFILFVGTRRPHKNLEGLIRALALLRNEYKQNVDLVICGKRYADYRKPEGVAEELGLQAHTHFLDFLPDAELAALYRRARALALVSFYEGFGLPLLEAMAVGTPVVGSTVSAIPEIVGDAGLLANPYEPADIAAKLHLLLSDAQAWRRFSQAGKIRANDFSWKAVAKATLNVYITALTPCKNKRSNGK